MDQLFINNEFVNAESGRTFSALNPATEKVIAEVQEAGLTDVNKAVAAAVKAYQPGSEWRQMDAPSRSELLLKFARLMRRDLDYLAVSILGITFNLQPITATTILSKFR